MSALTAELVVAALREYSPGPSALVWAGVEESVDVVRTWREDREGVRRVCFRLAMQDGGVVDISRTEPTGTWHLDRESEAGIAERDV